jgi:integrase
MVYVDDCQWTANFVPMPRKKVQQWPRIRINRNRSGTVSYLVDLSTGTSRERKFFKTKDEAEIFAEQRRVERTNHGTAALVLSEGLRQEAIEMNQRLRLVGHSLTSAVEFFFKPARPASDQKTVQEVIVEMVQKRREAGRSEDYLRVQTLVLNNFAKVFGTRPINTVMSKDIEDWLSSNIHWKPRTRLNYQRDLRGLWNYALKHRYAAHNPLDVLEAPTLTNEPPGIFTPAQAKSLLLEAAKPQGNGMLPYIAIGLFAGLRSAEIERLDWAEVDLETSLIEVTAKKAKTRQRRHVAISKNLSRWLKPFVKKKPKGPVAPAMARLDLQLVGIACRAGIEEWPKNALRHSFASYHLAMYKDAGKTALELGHHNQDMLFRNYRQLVKPAQAAQFWQIVPE